MSNDTILALQARLAALEARLAAKPNDNQLSISCPPSPAQFTISQSSCNGQITVTATVNATCVQLQDSHQHQPYLKKEEEMKENEQVDLIDFETDEHNGQQDGIVVPKPDCPPIEPLPGNEGLSLADQCMIENAAKWKDTTPTAISDSPSPAMDVRPPSTNRYKRKTKSNWIRPQFKPPRQYSASRDEQHPSSSYLPASAIISPGDNGTGHYRYEREFMSASLAYPSHTPYKLDPRAPCFCPSRAVLITDLPPTINYHDLTCRIRGGALSSIQLADTRPLIGSMTAFVRFLNAPEAASFAGHYSGKPLYIDSSGQPIGCVALISTPSAGMPARCYDPSMTRCFEVAVPAILAIEESSLYKLVHKCVASHNIVSMTAKGLSKDGQESNEAEEAILAVECSSIEAARDCRWALLERGSPLRGCLSWFVPDPCAAPLLASGAKVVAKTGNTENEAAISKEDEQSELQQHRSAVIETTESTEEKGDADGARDQGEDRTSAAGSRSISRSGSHAGSDVSDAISSSGSSQSSRSSQNSPTKFNETSASSVEPENKEDKIGP